MPYTYIKYDRHRYILNGEALPVEKKEKYMSIMLGRAGKIEYAKALEFLSKCLESYHEKKTVILIDEYDVPLGRIQAPTALCAV